MKTMKNIMSIALILLVAMSVFVGCNPKFSTTEFTPEDKAQIEEFWGDAIPFLDCMSYEILTGTDSINGECLTIWFKGNKYFMADEDNITEAHIDDYIDKLMAFVGKDAKYTEYASEYVKWEIITKGNKSIAVQRTAYLSGTGGIDVMVRLYNCAVTEIG